MCATVNSAEAKMLTICQHLTITWISSFLLQYPLTLHKYQITNTAMYYPCRWVFYTTYLSGFHTKQASPTQQQIIDTVGEMFCNDLTPYSVVENEGVWKLLGVAALRKDVPELYQNVKTKVKGIYWTYWKMEGISCWIRNLDKQIFNKVGHWIEYKQSAQVGHKCVAALLSMEVINVDHRAANILHHLSAPGPFATMAKWCWWEIFCWVFCNRLSLQHGWGSGWW